MSVDRVLTAWGLELGHRIGRFIDEEQPGTLIEFPLSAEERDRLALLVRALPIRSAWVGSDRACVAVHAVHLAAHSEAAGFRTAFFQDLQRSEDTQLWESLYGSEIERFLVEKFGHTPSQGPYRYVGTIYRHAGITPRGTPGFAAFLHKLLASSPTVRRQDYDDELKRLNDSLIKPFLQSDAGFEFTRQTAGFLAEHKYRGRSLESLSSLAGYRPGFWKDFLDAYVGHVPSPGRATIPPPRLCLDVLTGRIVLMFDPRWVARGTYRIGGRPLRSAVVPASMTTTFSYEAAGASVSVDPWWTPLVSPWALFRACDGALVHVGRAAAGSVTDLPPDRYVFVGPISLAPQGDDFGYLDVPDTSDSQVCAVRQFELAPAALVEPLSLRGLSSERQLPSIEFASSDSRRALLGGLFFGTLPDLVVRNWVAGSFRRYRVIHESGPRLSELAVPNGSGLIKVEAACPSHGSIRIEFAGVDYAKRSLPRLDYTVLPTWAAPKVLGDVGGPLDQARVALRPAPDWKVSDGCGATEDTAGEWLLPAGVSSWSPIVSGPAGFSAELQVDVPVAAVELGVQLEHGILKSTAFKGMRAAPVVVTGPAWSRATVSVVSGASTHVLIDGLELGPLGRARMSLGSCLDQLETCTIPVGKIAVSISGGRPLFQKMTWLNVEAVASSLHPLGPNGTGQAAEAWASVPEDAPPLVAEVVEALWALQERPLKVLDVGSVLRRLPELGPVAAGNGLMATMIDGTQSDLSDSELEEVWLEGRPAEQDELCRLRSWWRQAAADEPPTELRNARWQTARLRVSRERWTAKHLPQEVLRFRQAVIEHSPEQSPFHGLDGHDDLFTGTERYVAAMTFDGEARYKRLALATGALDRAAERATRRGPVHSVALIVRTVVQIRWGQALSTSQLDVLNVEVGSEFASAVDDLRVLAGHASVTGLSGIRLSDIVPVDNDRSQP